MKLAGGITNQAVLGADPQVACRVLGEGANMRQQKIRAFDLSEAPGGGFENANSGSDRADPNISLDLTERSDEILGQPIGDGEELQVSGLL